MEPYRREPVLPSVCESTVTVPFRVAHPSFLLDTVQVRVFDRLYKFWEKFGIDAPSINTRPVYCALGGAHFPGSVDTNVQGSSRRSLG